MKQSKITYIKNGANNSYLIEGRENWYSIRITFLEVPIEHHDRETQDNIVRMLNAELERYMDMLIQTIHIKNTVINGT